jgi:hypothetical protein
LLPWVETGGLLLFPGSNPPPAIPSEDSGAEFERCSVYRVPLNGAERSLWIARKR